MSDRISRRAFSQSALSLGAVALTGGAVADPSSGTPVILDTDIGDDIDDTWALLMLLRMPGIDLKLAVGDFGNAIYRARLLAKLLQVSGRCDVPVGLGNGKEDRRGLQSEWLGDYALSNYPGLVHEDGVQAIIDTIHDSTTPMTVICIGPVPNIAAALQRDPSITLNARFVGMHGSITVGYDSDTEPSAEWNVRSDPQALQEVFAAPWECTITPLDTCGKVILDGDNYRSLRESCDPRIKALMENYELWLPHAPYIDPQTDANLVSTTLFDTVAVHLATSEDFMMMQDLPLRVTDDGYTVIDEDNGRPVRCALSWTDLAAFEKRVVSTLLG